MPLLKSIKTVLRPYRRSIFETFGSERYSHLSGYDIDRRLAKHLTWRNGTFVEAGANDGLLASNSYWFERFLGWRGILVEAAPLLVAACRRNRPKAQVFHCALVESDTIKRVIFAPGASRGYVPGAFNDPEHEKFHRKVAADELGVSELEDVEVPARTLASIIEEANIGRIDLLSLDVEGYELKVFRGMNVEKHRPRFLCVETRDADVIRGALNGHYEIIEQLSEDDYLFRAKD